MSAGLPILKRLATGQATAADIEQLGRWAGVFLRAGGSLPMERCFQLPQTLGQHEKCERDQWLEIAAAILIDCGAPSAEQVKKRLAVEWDGFLRENLWKSYRDDGRPPQGINRFTEALFMASRLNKGRALSARHIGNVLGNFLAL